MQASEANPLDKNVRTSARRGENRDGLAGEHYHCGDNSAGKNEVAHPEELEGEKKEVGPAL